MAKIEKNTKNWPKYGVRPATLVARMREAGKAEAQIERIFNATLRNHVKPPK